MKNKVHKEKILRREMNKKGEIVTVVAVVSFIVMAGSLIAGSYYLTNNNDNSNIVLKEGYVGNIESRLYYGFECVGKIEKDKRVFFEEISQAKDFGFEYGGECPKV